MAAPLTRHEVETLFRKYGPLVRRRARGILGDDASAEDATQDVFMKVLGSLEAFRRESQPSTWLYRITTNLCLNRIRDGKRHRARLEELGATRIAAAKAAATQLEPDKALVTAAILSHVAPELAEVAVYYHVDEMDQEEISRVIGTARRTVGYRLQRFREEALKFLKSEPGPGTSDGAPAANPALGVQRSEDE